MCPLTLNETVTFARCALTPFCSLHIYGSPTGSKRTINIYIYIYIYIIIYIYIEREREREKGTVDSLRRLASLAIILIIIISYVIVSSKYKCDE